MKQLIRGACMISAALCSTAAMAQVVVYGIVDSGIEYVTNINAAGSAAVKMPSPTGSFPSRIGFKGSEDLGNGLSAIFALESGFGVDTGTPGQGGRLFGRQALVGLKGGFGTVTLGRQVNMTYLSTMKSDVMGPNLHSIGSLDGYLPNSRSDNALGYLGKFDAITVGATASLGRDVAASGGPGATNCAGESGTDSKACRQLTAMLGYDGATFGLNGVYDKLNGGAGAAGGLIRSDFFTKRIGVHGYLMIDTLKLGLGVIERKTHAATDSTANLLYIGVSYPFAPNWVVDTQAARLDVKDSADCSTMLTARASYNFSKRTAAYASLGHIRNSGKAALSVSAGDTVGAGMSQNSLMLGLRHSF